MIVILAFDGLEYDFVKKFKFPNLMQQSYGKTDLSGFTEPRTVVIWSSFLSGKNQEKRILSLLKQELWDFSLKPEETFFSHFGSHLAIDVPGYTFIKEHHENERKLLKGFFNKENSVEDYDKACFENHKRVKAQFFEALEKDYDILLGYFNIADVIGHLSFGVESKMKMIYEELDKIVEDVKAKVSGPVLVISDHGMKAIGRFGDHSENGFWSFNSNSSLENPKPTEFYDFIVKEMKATSQH